MIKNLERKHLPAPIRGMNDTDDETKLPMNMLVDVLNYETTGKGIVTRDGYSAYSTSGLPSSEYINFMLTTIMEDSSQHLLSITETNICVETTTGVFSSLASGLTSTYPFYTAVLNDIVIISSRGNAPRKYNGSTVSALAVTAPTAAPTAALGVAGDLTGDYMYKYTFVSASGAETLASPACGAITTTSDKVNLSDVAVGGADVVKRKIYRTLAGGTTLFYYLDVLNNNTATTYVDNISDAQLTTDLEPLINDPPPTGLMFLTVYKKYLFAVKYDEPTALYHTHSSYPELWYVDEISGYRLNVGGEDGQPIIGLGVLRGSLYVFKTSSTWPIIGSHPDDFQVAPEPINQSHSLWHRSIAYIDYGSGTVMVGLSSTGFLSFDGYSFKNLGVQSEAGINISKFFASLDKEQLEWATGYDDKKNFCYRCSVRRSGMGYADRELVWNYKYNSITILDRKWNSMVE